MSFETYINDFERLYNKDKVFNIKLSDQVRTYRLLKYANLEKNKIVHNEMKAELSLTTLLCRSQH